MTKLNYTPEHLRSLMATSAAYQSLSAPEKAAIEDHIVKNNKPMLLYIYQKLQQESDSHEISRQQLAKKILHISPSEQQKLAQNLKNRP